MEPNPGGLDIAQVASDILESARGRAGKASVLAMTLEQMGVVGEGGAPVLGVRDQQLDPRSRPTSRRGRPRGGR